MIMEKAKSKIVGSSTSISRKNDKSDLQKESKSVKKSDDDVKCMSLSLETEKIQTSSEEKSLGNSDYKDTCCIQVRIPLTFSTL